MMILCSQRDPRQPLESGHCSGLTARKLLGFVRAGEAMQFENLRVVPLCAPAASAPVFTLLGETPDPRLSVTEIDQDGLVQALVVNNGLDIGVLLIEGQELVGAKQNRIVNADAFVRAGEKVRIPVSCVEQGRWRHVSREFHSGGYSPRSMRARTSSRVHANLFSHGSYEASQGEVWKEVSAYLHCSQTTAPTMALRDVYRQRESQLARVRDCLARPEGAIGAAFFDGERLLGIELFDRPAALGHCWPSIVDSYALDLVLTRDGSAPLPEPEAAPRSLEQVLQLLDGDGWERYDAPGAGQNWRLRRPGLTASALVLDEERLLHLQALATD